MKRKNRTNRMVAFLAAIILTVFGLCQAAFAADTNTTNTANIDAERPVSLNIKLTKEDNSIDTDRIASILIYQIGEWDGSQGRYVLTEDYASSSAILEWEDGVPTLGKVKEEIKILQEFIAAQNLPALVEGKTQNGQYRSPELSMGLYLVCSSLGDEMNDGDNTRILPFLTTLPLWVEQDNASGYWQYAVEAFPKHEPFQNTTNPTDPTPNTPGGNSGGGGGGGGSRARIDPEGTPTTTIGEEGTPLEGLTPPPSELIDEEGVPLSDGPFQQLIEEVLVPLGLLPKTGNGSISYAPLLALMAASVLLIMGLVWRRIRKAH